MSPADLSSLARRLVVGLGGTWPSAREEAWLRRWSPGGVILFSRNVSGAEQLASLCVHLHDLVPGCEIVADHEGGPVSQLAAAAGRPPVAWALGELDDHDLTRRVHAETGRRCRRLGIDRILAPCCDVLTEIHNPVIGSRAFGSDPELVLGQVAGAVAGLREAGIASCLKHWPGHGGSRVDSHIAVSRIGDGAHDSPFLAGLQAGSGAVMVGHLYRGGIGSEKSVPVSGRDLPATLDQDWLKGSRKSLGEHAETELCFYADDVTMGALRAGMRTLGEIIGSADQTGLLEPEELSISWLQVIVDAGCDRLLVRGIPWGVFAGPEPSPSSAEPLDGAEVDAPGPGPQEGAAPGSTVYYEARRRSWEAAGMDGFSSSDSDLVWLDFTAGDRWEVAAGDGVEKKRQLARCLKQDFKNVWSIDGRKLATRESLKSGQRLLITSHRPLTIAHSGRSDLPELLRSGLADTGHCLVMGHPSLAGDVGSWLSPGWSLSALYDTTVEDYRGGSGRT